MVRTPVKVAGSVRTQQSGDANLTANRKQYVLTRKLRSQLVGRGAELTCYRCGESLQAGERVHCGGTRYRTKRCHLACWESLFIEG